jgi:hypothetical protein
MIATRLRALAIAPIKSAVNRSNPQPGRRDDAAHRSSGRRRRDARRCHSPGDELPIAQEDGLDLREHRPLNR